MNARFDVLARGGCPTTATAAGMAGSEDVARCDVPDGAAPSGTGGVGIAMTRRSGTMVL